MMRFGRWLSLLMAMLAMAGWTGAVAGAGQAGDRPAPVLAITAVNVLPMTAGEPVLRNRTVLVENGRIAAIGPSARVRIPAGAVRISGRGQYLVPGLADMHVHLEYFDDPAFLNLFLASGVTVVRSMDGRPYILDWKQRIAAGTLSGPIIHAAGQVLDGSPPVRDDNQVVATPDEARRIVAEQSAAGYEYIKVYQNLTPPVFDAIVGAARAHNRPVVGHVPDAVPLEAYLASGAASLEHLGDFASAIAVPPSASGTPPPSLRRRLGFAVDPARIEALAARVAASGIRLVPTLITADRTVASAADVEQWAGAPEAAGIDSGILAYWRGSVARARERLGESNWHWVAQARANRLAVVRAMHRAGVQLLVGTDTPNPFVFPGASIHDELENFLAAGMTPGQALAAATREPARFLGQDRLWGTIAPGMGAELVLLEANPLDDIRATRRIAGVVAGGQWLSPARLREMRQQVERIAAADG